MAKIEQTATAIYYAGQRLTGDWKLIEGSDYTWTDGYRTFWARAVDGWEA